VSLLYDFIGYARQVANGVADIFETLGGCDFAGLRDGHDIGCLDSTQKGWRRQRALLSL
jgi:hypothetical protein